MKTSPFRMKLGLVVEMIRDDAPMDKTLEDVVNAALDYAAGASFTRKDLDEIWNKVDARAGGSSTALALSQIMSAITVEAEGQLSRTYLATAKSTAGINYWSIGGRERMLTAATRWAVRLVAFQKGTNDELRVAALAAAYGGAIELAAELIGTTLEELEQHAKEILAV